MPAKAIGCARVNSTKVGKRQPEPLASRFSSKDLSR
jgi:hypothetical protein